jgi:hypothetical protein
MNITDKTPRQVEPRPSPPQTFQRWEYHSCLLRIDIDLSQFGQDGWELVNVAVAPHDPSKAMFFFKRRR